jgi:hypothetical protein
VFPALKAVLKRGALVAAANWPVVLIQAVADSLFKLLIMAPLVGGVVLVTLIVGADPGALVSLGWRELVPAIVAALQSRPAVLLSFLAALAVVLVGGSLFVFLIKAGTVSVLVRGERDAGAVERPPLRLGTLASASRFSVELFVESARRLFPSYARLGLLLLATYLVSGAAYVAVVFSTPAGRGWTSAALVTVTFAAWITFVNFLYLLMQIVMAATGARVSTAAGRLAGFLRQQYRMVAAVFGVVLVLVVFATGASILATALLGTIGFVPFLGLTVLPLQILAWLLRSLVFQYIGLASIGAYLRLYRAYTDASTAAQPIEAGAAAALGGRV